MALLSLRNITKRFGGLTAVDDVSFDVGAGELIAVVGPNGAGKTTLFNMLSGVFFPDAGRIEFDGRDMTTVPPYRRARMGLGRTFQIPRPFGSATVRENVAIGAMFGAAASENSVDRSMDVAEHYLDMVGLKEHRDKTGASLTPVEKKLMEIARALAMQPKLLLLDEAMAGMNPKAIDQMVELLLAVRKQEKIAIVGLVEHIMRAVAGLAERVIVMHHGAVLMDAPTREALTDQRVIDVYLGRASEASDAGS